MSVDFFVAVLWFHFSTWLSLFFIDSFFGCVLMHSCMYSIVAFGVFFAFLVFWTSIFSLILRRSSDVMTPDVVPVLFVLMGFAGLVCFKCLPLCGIWFLLFKLVLVKSWLAEALVVFDGIFALTWIDNHSRSYSLFLCWFHLHVCIFARRPLSIEKAMLV